MTKKGSKSVYLFTLNVNYFLLMLFKKQKSTMDISEALVTGFEVMQV